MVQVVTITQAQALDDENAVVSKGAVGETDYA